MKRIVWPLFLAIFFIQSCNQQPWLSGKVDMSNGEDWKPMVYLIQPNSWGDVAQSFTGPVVDSTVIASDGSFRFSRPLPIDDTALLEVTVQRKGEKYPNRLVNEDPQSDNYFPMLISPSESIVVTATINGFQSSFSIQTPSKVNKEMMHLRDIRQQAYRNYSESYEKAGSSDEALLEKEKTLQTYQIRLMQFADSTKALIPALMAIKWASPTGDFEHLPEALYKQSNKWQEIAPDHPWVKELTGLADKSNWPIMIGDSAPDVTLPMKNRDHANLDEFTTGKKLLLLDVWASWCAPCRVENREVLVPLWEKYHDKGFGILAYGLESSQVAWEKAIQRDGAFRWQHASHLLGDQNPFMDSLRLKTIPANFLLDTNGKVLAKNLHGMQLVQFVDGYMQLQ